MVKCATGNVELAHLLLIGAAQQKLNDVVIPYFRFGGTGEYYTINMNSGESI